MNTERIELVMDRVPSPIGTLLLVTRGETLQALFYGDAEEALVRHLRARFGEVRLIEPAREPESSGRLRAYLAGDMGALDAVPADGGGTPFQQRVWSALRRIPPGSTTSYGALAARLGHPSASRAVGLANAQNPIAIVVPCHRVVGAGGALTGYAGGLERKRWLLGHEAARTFALE